MERTTTRLFQQTLSFVFLNETSKQEEKNMQRFIKLVTLLETENVQETEQSPGPERVGKQDALTYLFTKLPKKCLKQFAKKLK